MAFVVVTSLLGIVKNQLLEPPPLLDNILDNTLIEIAESLSDKLCFLQAILLEKKTVNPALDAEIRDVAVETEAEIESQLRSVYLAAHNNDGDSVVEACDGLHQTLQQALKDIESLEIRIQNEKEINSDNEMVGFEDDFQSIKDIIIDQQSAKTLEVISITGMGGIGKTTLAKSVYKDSQIVANFDVRAWAIVSQVHQVKEILIHLLHCIDPTNSKIYNKGHTQLQAQLRKGLLGRRYLLLIDDIWSCKAWDDIKRCFPENEIGSRILITTRENDVAEYASSSKYIHSMRFLNPHESWNLFKKKVFEEKQILCTPELESVGKSIVKKCNGLPLAVLVVAGLLASPNKSPQVWDDVVENMDSLDPDKKLIGMISLSYNYLPVHLKACLIYLGVFPENSDIPVNKLINLWVAEGFLKEKKEMAKSLEEVAKSYLHNLINRNLVQVSKRSLDGNIKSCKLHDMLHDMCRKEAQREFFFSVGTIPSPDCRWISCVSSHWPTSNKIHSILYFGKSVHIEKLKLVFSGLKMLRVLDLSSLKCWYGLPSEIDDLVHLRYLALSALGFLGNLQLIKLQNLQTLIVCSWRKGCRLQLPRDVLELPRLRHVHVDKSSALYLPRLVKKDLQTLLWLRVNGQDPSTTDFKKVPVLKELWVYIDNELPRDAFDSLADLNFLEKLKFEMGSVKRFYFPTALLKHLKKLTLRNTYLPWKDMKIIGRLPNLEVLKLKDFAFSGPEWETDGMFQKLKIFVIAHLDLKCWYTDASNFPVLERLVLRSCWYLKKLPAECEEFYTLQLIELDNCCHTLVKSAKKIRKVQKSMGGSLVIHNFGSKIDLQNEESSEEENGSCEDGSEDSQEEMKAVKEVNEELDDLRLSKTG